MKKLFAAACLVACIDGSAQERQPAAPLDIELVGLNDFHGNLEAGRFAGTPAGGVEALGAALQAWRKLDKDLLLVAAGDIVGASPALSSMWADEPSIVAMNMLGLRVSALGNHEFDQGRAELLRQQHGGCASSRPLKACKLDPAFKGAKFRYLAANVIDAATGKPFVPAYRIEEVKGVKIAFIGAVVRDVASLGMPTAIAGLQFKEEAASINALMPELKARGATVFVVLIHEGGRTPEAFDKTACAQLAGPIVDITKRLDPAIRLVISGHSHQGYQCEIDGRTVTQAEMGGHMLSRIKLSLDPATRTVRSVQARNVLVKPGEYPADEALTAYMQSVRAVSATALAKPVARVAVPQVPRQLNFAGESPLGNLVADAFLDAGAAQKAEIAFMNYGGIRENFDVRNKQIATAGEAQVVLPFGNLLVLMDLSGAEIRALIEQQWQREDEEDPRARLQISKGLSYRWDHRNPKGQRIVDLRYLGAPLEEERLYKVATNDFLAEGGSAFTVFAKARNKLVTNVRDLDAFVAYLEKRDKAGHPAGSNTTEGRIERDQ